MNSDSYFAIGKTHDVCQDYARHGAVTDMQAWHRDHPYAIVCDGCSGCPDTDVGARLLGIAAEARFIQHDNFDYQDILNRAVNAAAPLGLGPYSLSATLLTAHVTDQGRLRCAFIGDGVIAVRMKDGTGFIAESDHNGAPKYLSYMLAAPGQYEDMFPAVRRVVWSQLTEKPALCPELAVDDYVTGFELNADDVELVLLMTDGAGSFIDAEFRRVPVSDVVRRLMDIKSLTGEFVKRRVKFFLTKECPKLGWQHGDDLGVVGIIP